MEKANEDNDYCMFCDKVLIDDELVVENDTCYFLSSQKYNPRGVLVGAGVIIPKRHVSSPFDLNDDEAKDIFDLLRKAKKIIDEKHSPDGYSIGWNVGKGSDQVEKHVHLHVMPRYSDEPLAGKGIRYFLKQESNRRKSFE